MASMSWFQRLRVGSGLVLFAFLASHLVNHSLGNISLEALETGRRVFLAVWRNPAGSLVLYAAIVVHAALVGFSILRRRRLRMPPAEAIQIVAGLAIPLLIATHVVATRGAHEFHDIADSYAYVLLSLWVWDWPQGVLQSVALLVAWAHGCLGLHFWLRLRPGYERWQGVLQMAAVLLPAAALAGFSTAGREAAYLAGDALWLQQQLALIGLPNDAAAAWVENRTFWVRAVCAVAVGGIVGYRLLRFAIERRHTITITYPGNRHVVVDLGHTVLEASRAGRIPHASVCGGRGRCSTCRVRVLGEAEALPEPSEQEQLVLKRIAAPKGVRLACQLKPRRSIDVVPLLPPTAQVSAGYRKRPFHHGSEQEIAILFGDLRAFTRFSENRLPYDVVFVINQYFRRMGDAVEGAGGRIDKFIGDGVMALFGIESGCQQGCRQALRAAAAMADALTDLNRLLAQDIGETLRMGIGIHAGPSVVGEMGYRNAVSVTAVGDAVNIASRLEAATKEFGCQLVVSEAVALAAGVDLSHFPRHEIQVRGRDEPLAIYAIDDATKLEVGGGA